MDQAAAVRPAGREVGAGFILLVLLCLLAVVAALSSANAAHWANHSLHVRRLLASLQEQVVQAESGQRGYLLTQNRQYLGGYITAVNAIPATEADLRKNVVDNPDQQHRLDQLYPLIAQKLDEMRRSVQLHDAGRHDQALVLVNTQWGIQLMQRIQTAFEQSDNYEAGLFAHRRDNATLQRLLLLFATLITTLFAGAMAWRVRRDNLRQQRAMAHKNLALEDQIRKREAAELQLGQAQKMEALGKLTGGVAHDFNNMLAIVVGNLEMAGRRLPSDETQVRSYVNNALAGAMRGADLTRRLLAFSRLQPLQPKAVDVSECVRNMSTIFRRSIGEDVQIETVQGGGLWRAFVDRPQLESALLNLAVNSRDAMQARGKLTIETANAYLDQAYADRHAEVTAGQYVMLAVTDTGSGMTPEVLQRAFDPFFTTKEPGNGTGLGLSQVHGFVKQSRGHVTIYSEPGTGTTVKMYLPRASVAAEAEVIGEHFETIAHSARKILVVEDDADVRQFVVTCVQELGYAVVQADGAEMARRRLAENPDVALLLTDVVMPGTNGRQLVDSIKESHPRLQVLYMTGYTRNAIVHNGMLDPGVRLITKPFTLQELAREIRAIFPE